MKNTKNLKTIVFSLGLAVMMLTANNLNAQNDGSRGLFGMGGSSADKEYSTGSLMKGDPISFTDEGVYNNGIGETVPLGSGVAIMLVAGLGYVALKKKED